MCWRTLLSVLLPDQVERIFAIVNDVRTLVLHIGSVAKEACSNLALGAVNPSFTSSPLSGDCDYTMGKDQFKEVVSTNTTLQEPLRDARPLRRQNNSW
ncbi:hypothetical protein BDB00DRAFT_913518, partial [Zychaea mexicana]|uniref:uncharacterized protein n=1 Tax=Zychaea mexicana TaxID=64656 RepID=UPI0022FE54E1